MKVELAHPLVDAHLWLENEPAPVSHKQLVPVLEMLDQRRLPGDEQVDSGGVVELEAREGLPYARPAGRLKRHAAYPAQLEEPLEAGLGVGEGCADVDVYPSIELHRRRLVVDSVVAEVGGPALRRELQDGPVPVERQPVGDAVSICAPNQVGEEEGVPVGRED